MTIKENTQNNFIFFLQSTIIIFNSSYENVVEELVNVSFSRNENYEFYLEKRV